MCPADHGVHDNSGFRFPDTIETLGTQLKARGYRTGAFVSAYPLDSRFGLARGFDVYDDSFVDAQPRPAFLEQERPGVETVALARQWIESGRDGVWVTDLDSTNGTFVNGERVDGRRRLREGDLVRIGETELRYER